MTDVIIKGPKVAAPVEKMDVGESVEMPAHTNHDGGAAMQGFAPQVMDLNEVVRFDDPMELEAFMHDLVTIQTHPPTGAESEANERVITFRVRDKVQNVLLGGTQQVRRCIVEAMARCRNAYIKADAIPVSTSSDSHTYKNPTSLHTKALKYPFSVVHDPRGALGLRWLNQVLRDRI
jgi:hypothetical protein